MNKKSCNGRGVRNTSLLFFKFSVHAGRSARNIHVCSACQVSQPDK